jgi:hypothetical protein
VHRRPEWVEKFGDQKMFVTFGTVKAVLYQVVDVTAGDLLTLQVRAKYSAIESGLALRVGIDPEANINPWHQGVQWGPWQGETSPNEHYWPNPGDNNISTPRTLTCEGVTAKSDRVTLFLRLQNTFPGKDTSAFWMQAQLFKESDVVDPDPPGDDGDLARAIREGFAELSAAIRELKQ